MHSARKDGSDRQGPPARATTLSARVHTNHITPSGHQTAAGRRVPRRQSRLKKRRRWANSCMSALALRRHPSAIMAGT